jgi:anthranilate synthase component 1
MQQAVRRRALGRWIDPIHAYEALFAGRDNAFLLESSDGAGWSYAGASDVVLTDLPAMPPRRVGPVGDPPLKPSFRLGWVGWLSYEGDARFLQVDRALAFDHAERAVWVLGYGDDTDWADELLDPEFLRDAQPLVPAQSASEYSVEWRHDDSHYVDLVNECKRYIAQGDAYQLCLTNTATISPSPDAWETYLRLRALSPSHHSGYIRIDGTTLISSSPEQFLSAAPTGPIRTKPIKGTRPRGVDAQADEDLKAELVESPKERAENLMIVDLMRNDLSKVARLGTVRVSALMEVETYPQVHQLVSTVEADLETGTSVVDAVRALFPAGSMTGAPKISAMSILNRLEHGPRGIYSGVFGYISVNGSVDLAMVIRSIVITPKQTTVGAGGGITAMSDAVEELAEMHLKAGALLGSIGVTQRVSSP